MLQIELFIENMITQFGLSIVLLILLSKGLLIGKPLPAIMTISTYAILFGYTTLESIIILCLLTAMATTSGEFVVFTHCKNPNHRFAKYIPKRVKNITNENDKGKLSNYLNKLFNKLSNKMSVTIFIGNVTTGFRGLASILAGKKQYPAHKFLIISYVATFVYHTILTYTVVTGFGLLF